MRQKHYFQRDIILAAGQQRRFWQRVRRNLRGGGHGCAHAEGLPCVPSFAFLVRAVPPPRRVPLNSLQAGGPGYARRTIIFVSLFACVSGSFSRKPGLWGTPVLSGYSARKVCKNIYRLGTKINCCIITKKHIVTL